MPDVAFLPAEPPRIPVPKALESDLVVFPREVDDDGTGLYDDAVIDLVKQLRNAGVGANYLHGPTERQWIGEKGFTPTEIAVVVCIAENLASSATWDGLKALFARMHGTKKHTKLKVGRCIESPDGTTTCEWLEVEGDSDDIVKAIEKFRTSSSGS